MINALNSGARVFMADLEDALSPTWANVVGGQAALRAAVRRELTFDSPEGKAYRLNDDDRDAPRPAPRLAPRRAPRASSTAARSRPPCSTSGCTSSTTRPSWSRAAPARTSTCPSSRATTRRGSGTRSSSTPRTALGIPRGTIRATVLIETILAAFEMDEILYELREHAAGLNAGRWDYLFSCIKKFRGPSAQVLPDRAQLTMTQPFMRAYTDLLVATCHRRGAHAIGGMAAFIPSAAATPRSTRPRWPRSATTRSASPATGSTGRGSPIRTSCRSRRRSSTASWATGPTRRTGSARTSP